MKVSVIVPIFKVEKFIARCAESLLGQSFNDVEYIFVNDATPDNSIHVLKTVIERYPNRKGQVKVVDHEVNKGLPSARNTGLSVATGDYVFHCDSDDYVELDMLELLVRSAENNYAEIVWSDWYLSFENSERYMKQPDYKNPIEALKGMLGGAMKYNVWNKLVKRSLYVDNNISFPDGHGMGEDMTMMMLFACAKTVSYCPRALYHYVKLNTEAFSQTYSERHLIDVSYNLDRVSGFLKENLGQNIEQDLAFLKLQTKLPLLISDGSQERYKTWEEWYPEVNGYIMQNKAVSLRSRIVQWFAWKRQWWLVWLYYQLVIRLVYGVIYK